MKDSLWKYIFGITFKEFIQEVRWPDMIFIFISFIIFYELFGWLGLIFAFIFCQLMGNLDGGAVVDLFDDYPIEEYPPNTCSDNIKDCKICNNEYSHKFNIEYNKKLKWYQKII